MSLKDVEIKKNPFTHAAAIKQPHNGYNINAVQSRHNLFCDLFGTQLIGPKLKFVAKHVIYKHFATNQKSLHTRFKSYGSNSDCHVDTRVQYGRNWHIFINSDFFW